MVVKNYVELKANVILSLSFNHDLVTIYVGQPSSCKI